MTKTLAFLLSASLAACAGGEAEVHYSGNATAPELVVLDSDSSVQVVANADEPIFYTENTYWLYRDNHWFRSRSHRGGWARVDTPPEHIRRIERPVAYVHFRGSPDRTTYNQRPEPVQRTPSPEPVTPAPYANPLPPQQLPPNADPNRPMRPMRPMPPDQVPPAAPDRDRPDHQIAPDPDRATTSPGQDGRAGDQRPATKGDDQSPSPGDHTKRMPDPDPSRRDLRPDDQKSKAKRGDDTSQSPTGRKGTPGPDQDKKAKPSDDKDKNKDKDKDRSDKN